jgi:CheY-like chemotaxis protein
VVHGIVASYGGACRVESGLGEGTHFAVYLPLARHVRRMPPDAAKAPVVRGSERVLVIDDERDVADVLVIGLGSLGYRVTAFNDPAAAIAAFDQTSDAWDIVISDQVMPRLDGFAVCARLKAIRPALRFILCTGFAAAAAEEQATEIGVDAFFIKPVSPERLAQCIRTLTSAAASAHA